ncbi:MAG: hypothetical protein COA79_03850 [Planctomycetota bacterium]|nr:MAG: hypothetical protein COA79_03850 [Planctomycetota bacterium]
MNTFSLTVSTIIALVLTSYIFLFEWSSKLNSVIHSKYILSFDPKNVIDFELKYKNNSSLKITRKKNTWKISLPIECKADQLTINSIMQKLPKLPKFSSVEEKDQKGLEAYGLKNPSLTLKITYQNNELNRVESRQLYFGKLTENKAEVFVKADQDSRIYLLHSAVLNILKQNWNNYRFKNLISMNKEFISKINFNDTDETWSIQKKNFTWFCEKPFTWKCDQLEINTFLVKFCALQINRFVENDLSKKKNYGLENPKQSIQFIDKDNKSYTIFFGETRAGSTFLHNTLENFIISVNADQLNEIIPNLGSARSMDFIESKPHEVSAIEYKNKTGNIFFKKGLDHKWEHQNKKYSLDQATIGNLIERFVIIVPEYYIDKNQSEKIFGFNENAQQITIENIKGFSEKITIGNKTNGWAIPSQLKYFTTQAEAIAYGKENKLNKKLFIPIKKSYYAKYNDFDQVFIIDPDLVSLFQRPIIYFTKKTFNVGKINDLRTIRRNIGDKEEIYAKLNSLKWIETSNDNKELKYQKLALLLLSLSDFTVDEWIKESIKNEDLKSYGLDKPKASITATFSTYINKKIKGKNKKTKVTAHFKFVFSHKTIRGNHFGCIFYRASLKDEFKSMNFIFTISPKRLIDRFLAKLH